MANVTQNTSTKDTVDLLKECNAGIKMGVRSFDDVIPKTKNEELKKILQKSHDEHCQLGDETHKLLLEYHMDDKDPHPIASGMSWVKTNVMLGIKDDDKTVADLITQGCNMGIKSLYSYLNQYAEADERVREVTKKLIHCEERLVDDINRYL